MDLMDDEDLKKSVIDKMMGELDDVTSEGLKKKPEGGPVKGVEISISVSPKSEEEIEEEMPEDEMCDVEGCEDPMHNHAPMEKEPESSDYISQLMKKLG